MYKIFSEHPSTFSLNSFKFLEIVFFSFLLNISRIFLPFFRLSQNFTWTVLQNSTHFSKISLKLFFEFFQFFSKVFFVFILKFPKMLVEYLLFLISYMGKPLFFFYVHLHVSQISLIFSKNSIKFSSNFLKTFFLFFFKFLSIIHIYFETVS